MIAFYTACKADRRPVHSQFTHKVICGSVEYDEVTKNELRQDGFILDEDGTNISDRNWTFADVANLYYTWQNGTEDFVGVNQYKRWWLSDLEPRENTIYVPDVIHLPVSVISHIRTNRETRPEYAVASEAYVSLSGNGAFPLDMTEALLSRDYTAHNMLAGPRPIFNKFIEILFEYLEPIYEACKDSLPRHDPYHARQMGFISEIIIDGIVKNRHHFFGQEVNFVGARIHG
jgi:hypothetical protein